MGLFINENEYPNLFKNNGEIRTTNQTIFKYDQWSELLHQQKQANDELNKAFHDLKQLYKKYDGKQTGRIENIAGQLTELKEINFQREAFEKFAIELLTKLDGRQSAMVEDEAQRRQTILEQIHVMNLSNQEIMQRLEKLQMKNEEMAEQQRQDSERMTEQMELQEKQTFSQEVLTGKQEELHEEVIKRLINQEDQLKNVIGRMDEQENHQQDVITRLESQEALVEKVVREINHIRSVIFERVGFLAGKIEHGYKLTSSYFTQLMNGSDVKEKIKNPKG
ncbi:hypothetical protein [Bacillus niameyensis]|uniref:hypothetical protein n=1 Tax=Bacillus niameyensis TaxID=1522308 RepID=UPI00078595F4|nr:hypothetical protein [Bacillus niameyensis]